MVCKYWFSFGNRSEQIRISALCWVYPNKPNTFIFKNPGACLLSLRCTPSALYVNHLQSCLPWSLPCSLGEAALSVVTFPEDLWGYFTKHVQFYISKSRNVTGGAVLSVGGKQLTGENPQPDSSVSSLAEGALPQSLSERLSGAHSAPPLPWHRPSMV